MTRWLVTGAGGALGRDLVSELTDLGQAVVGLDRSGLDVTDAAAVVDTLDALRPDVVINSAAYTGVDDAESHEEEATRVNGEAPGHLARWCAAHDARLVQVSTDYVFPGDATQPYEADAPPGPAGAYGRSKLAGERAVLASGGDVHVVRTGWLYGVHGPSFVRTVGARLRAGQQVEVVDDQRGAPTWTRHLARRLVVLGEAAVSPGVRHCSADGEATWYDVAVALATLVGADPGQVGRTTSATLSRPARRPAYSVLSNRSWTDAGLPPMPHWLDALGDAINATGDALVRIG